MTYNSEWISVKEKLPKENQMVRVSSRWRHSMLQKVFLCKIKGYSWKMGKITHEWVYPSGLYASYLDPEDEWMAIS